jgi:hypothetical protein
MSFVWRNEIVFVVLASVFSSLVRFIFFLLFMVAFIFFVQNYFAYGRIGLLVINCFTFCLSMEGCYFSFNYEWQPF